MPQCGHSAVRLASIHDLISTGEKILKHEKQPQWALASSATRWFDA
jgi:hypothetical protein